MSLSIFYTLTHLEGKTTSYIKSKFISLLSYLSPYLVRVILQLLLSCSASLIATFYKYICMYGRQNRLSVST